MELPEDAGLLRIFVGEADRLGSRPLYEAIVLEARERGLAGATVLRGMLGYGRSSRPPIAAACCPRRGASRSRWACWAGSRRSRASGSRRFGWCRTATLAAPRATF